MIIHFSNNYFKRVIGIAYYNFISILLFTVIAVLAVVQHAMDGVYHWTGLDLPVVPVTVIGSALAIFLGFRNNSAYDRWWEARKIWGGIVNTSRTLSSFIMTFPSKKHGNASLSEIEKWRESIIYRQICWLYMLKFHLRKQTKYDKVLEYMGKEEFDELMQKSNKPAQLLHNQNQAISYGYEQGMVDSFRHMELAKLVKELYSLQGMCERIKNTVFPFYYNYFTKVFLWIFIVCLPFSLAPLMGFMAIPMSIAISFVFYILDKSGEITEDPFEGRAADTPMSTITRSIEIDLLEMLGQKSPKPLDPSMTSFDVLYME